MPNIATNLLDIRQQLDLTAVKAGRDPSSVRLIAVSKTKPMALIHEAWEAGQVDFGENRPQELRDKQPQLPDAKWHMIGTLQRNKIKYLLPWIHLIHSVDSAKLLEEIDLLANRQGIVVDCLLQLNISEEDTKSGLEEDTTEALLLNIASFPGIRIRGLMGMAALTDDQSVIRQQFRRLRLAKERFSTISHPQLLMTELSMGMSGDFEIAIEEGSTMVRIGSALFGGR